MNTEQIITWLRDKLAYAPDHSWKRMMQEAIEKLERLKKLEAELGNRSVMDKPMTNADRFRSMPAEEQQKCVRRFWEIEDFADWLQQPAEPANLPDEDERDSGLLEED